MAYSRRWGKIGFGVFAGVTTISALFAILISVFGFEITGTDAICDGTIEDPCISYITIKNPTSYNVDIYNPNDIHLDFSPQIKEYFLFVKDGRCKGGAACAAPNGVSLNGYRYFDFTNKTKIGTSTTSYVIRFPAKTTKEFLLYGLKNNPNDVIKWGFGIDKNFLQDGYLDPTWTGHSASSPGVNMLDLDEGTHYLSFNETQGVLPFNFSIFWYTGLNNYNCSLSINDVKNVSKNITNPSFVESTNVSFNVTIGSIGNYSFKNYCERFNSTTITRKQCTQDTSEYINFSISANVTDGNYQQNGFASGLIDTDKHIIIHWENIYMSGGTWGGNDYPRFRICEDIGCGGTSSTIICDNSDGQWTTTEGHLGACAVNTYYNLTFIVNYDNDTVDKYLNGDKKWETASVTSNTMGMTMQTEARVSSMNID